jgi:hypothetical protein
MEVVYQVRDECMLFRFHFARKLVDFSFRTEDRSCLPPALYEGYIEQFLRAYEAFQ